MKNPEFLTFVFALQEKKNSRIGIELQMDVPDNEIPFFFDIFLKNQDKSTDIQVQ